MLAWILGVEDSFIKSFFYVLFLASIIVISGSALYVFSVGLPMIANKFARMGASQDIQ